MTKIIFKILLTIFLFKKSLSQSDDNIFRIQNGRPAQEGQFPSAVLLEIAVAYQCGGVIISESKVLSAAHCFVSDHGRRHQAREVFVIAGSIYRHQDPYTRGEKLAIHPFYSKKRSDYDVAVLVVETHFLHSAFVSPIALNPYPVKEDDECVVTGFGIIHKFAHVSDRLLYIHVTIDNHEICEEFYSHIHTPITSNMICAGSQTTGGVCKGDSGSGLICNGSLVGIVSFGKENCSSFGEPCVYMSIYAFIEWIEKAAANKCSKYSIIIIIISIILLNVITKYFN